MKRTQHGMSLVEVLVAVAIGLIGILIITQAYLASDSFNRSTLGEGGAQTNGTIALFTVQRDLRMAGYGMADSRALGCGSINYYYNGAYSANLSGGTLPNLTLAPVQITTTAGAPDTLTVMYSSDASRMVPAALTKTMPSPSAELNVDGTTGFTSGDLVLMVSNTSPVTCTMLQLTNVQVSSAKIQHNPGSSAPYNPPGGSSLFPAYSNNDLVFDLGNPVVRSYTVVKTDPTCTSGCQGSLRMVDGILQGGTGTPYDLVDGIVDLKAQYGKDNGVNNSTVSRTAYTPNDGLIDSYDTSTPTSSAGWNQVLTVRLAVLARVGNYVKPATPGANCTATTTMPTWSGSASGAPFDAIDVTTATSQDRCYKYRVFETVVPLRNMIWRVS
jgi:type IV pilus assembly protein PilW